MSRTPSEPSQVTETTDSPAAPTTAEFVTALARERLLSAVGREVTAARDIASILERVLAHLARSMSLTGGSIALVEDGALAVVAAHDALGETTQTERLPLGGRIAERVITRGLSYRSDDVQAETEIRLALSDAARSVQIRSYLAVPLVAHGQTVGILQVDSTLPAAFSAADQELIEAVAAQVANSVERARLQAIVQEQTRVLEAQNDELRATADRLTAQNEELRAAAIRLAAQNEELQEQREELAARALHIEELVALVARHAAELRATIASISDGVWIVRRDGSLLVNAAAIAMFGLQGLGPLDGIHDIGTLMEVTYVDGAPVALDDLPLAHALRGDPVSQREEWVKTRATGRRVAISASSAPVLDPNGVILGAVAIHRDITHLKEAQQVREDFLAMASHELRTPVTSIKGLIQLTARRLQRDHNVPQALEGLASVDAQVDRLVGLVDELLDVNRIESRRMELRRERLDLGALVRDAVRRFQATTGLHRLLLDAPSEPLWVDGDANRLDQVLDNLLSNAIKYSPEGGDVVVVAAASGADALVTVRDPGIGIPEAERQVLFGRFRRASNATERSIAGFGLGLSISREIMESQGGRLWLEESGDSGSTFAMSLPMAT